jgi:hypothetical protein
MRHLGRHHSGTPLGRTLAASSEQAAELRLASAPIESRQSADHELNYLQRKEAHHVPERHHSDWPRRGPHR